MYIYSFMISSKHFIEKFGNYILLYIGHALTSSIHLLVKVVKDATIANYIFLYLISYIVNIIRLQGFISELLFQI